MRIAVIINLAPRKLGSLEHWLVAICAEGRRRGYHVDVFGREPVHPKFGAELSKLRVGWGTTDELERDWPQAIRRLSTYDVLHLNLFQPRTRMALLAYAAWPARVLLVDHSSGPIPSSTKDPIYLSAARAAADHVSLARVHGLAGVCDYVRDRDRRRFGLRADQVRTLYNGVDPRRLSTGRDPDSAPEDTTLLTVQYLIPAKGIDTLLHAVARMRNTRTPLRVAGDGPEAGRLEALAQELGIAERVQFLGLRDDVPELLRAADVFVHPAIWQEACAYAILEALGSGRAVVASRRGGTPELIEHGVSGLLVEPGNADAFAQTLDYLVENPRERARLGRNARRRVQERFSLQASIQGHLAWIEEAAASESLARKVVPRMVPLWST